MRNQTHSTRSAFWARTTLLIFGMSLMLVMMSFLRTEAATIVVSDTCNPVDAVSSANSDSSVGGCPAGSGADTVVFSNTTYVYTTSNPAFNFTLFPQITSDVTILGNGAVIQRDLSLSCPAAENSQFFYFFLVNPSGSLTVEDLTLQNGCMEGTGGIASGGQLALNNSRLISNLGALAGGIYAPDGVITVTNSAFLSNTSYSSGGAIIFEQGVVRDSEFTGNTARGDNFPFFRDGAGGAIAMLGQEPKLLLSNRIYGNRSGKDGAAIYLAGVAHMENNLLYGNEFITDGVSVDIAVGSLNVNSPSTLYGAHNTLVARPGITSTAFVVGLGATSSRIFLTDTLISGYKQGLVTVENGAIVANGLLWDNTAIQTVGASITVTNDFVGSAAFADPVADDYKLSSASDAINRAVSNLPSFDFEGDARPYDGFPDVGYDEFVPNASLIVSKTVGTAANECASSDSLTVAANTKVYYCVTLYNSGDVTLTQQLVSDPLLDVESTLSLVIAPATSVQITPSLISAFGPVTMTEAVTNTVFVTATFVVDAPTLAGVAATPLAASDSAQAIVRVDLAPPVDDQLWLPSLERQ